MKGQIKYFLIVPTIFAAAGCSTWDKLNQTERGAVIGTGSGAALGGAISGDAGGALLGGAAGGVAGGLIGHEMDRDDRGDYYRDRRGRYRRY